MKIIQLKINKIASKKFRGLSSCYINSMHSSPLSKRNENVQNQSIPVDEFSLSLTKIASKIQELQSELINFTAKFNKDPDYQKEKLNRSQPSSSKLRNELFAEKSKENLHNKNIASFNSRNSVSAYQTLRDESVDISLLNCSARPVLTMREQTQSDEDVYDCITSDILQKLKIIFKHYAGDKSSTSHLKLSKYRKMINECPSLVDYAMSLENLELYFMRYNKSKNGLDFEAFLELLVKISSQKYLYLHYTDKEALQCLLESYILPLYDQISTTSSNGISDIAVDLGEKTNEEILTIVKAVYPVLIRIYKEYFAWENKRVDKMALLKPKSEEGFWAFLRDFEICPGIITKSLASSLWSQSLDDVPGSLFDYKNNTSENYSWLQAKDVGILFKFAKFCEVLVKIAIHVNKTQSDKNSDQVKQFVLFLERMEFSRGMAKFAKQGQRFLPKHILQKAILQTAENETIIIDDDQISEIAKYGSVLSLPSKTNF